MIEVEQRQVPVATEPAPGPVAMEAVPIAAPVATEHVIAEPVVEKPVVAEKVVAEPVIAEPVPVSAPVAAPIPEQIEAVAPVTAAPEVPKAPVVAEAHLVDTFRRSPTAGPVAYWIITLTHHRPPREDVCQYEYPLFLPRN